MVSFPEKLLSCQERHKKFGRLHLLKLFTKILEQNYVLEIAIQFLLAFIYICELSHLFLFDRHIH